MLLIIIIQLRFSNTIINVNSDIRLSQQIHYIINHKKTGIFHLGSTDLISHYDFIKTLLIRRHKKIGILKQVFTSNTIRYLATLPKEINYQIIYNHLILMFWMI